MTTIQCEICLHKLATVETLALPLTGAMFSPPDPWMPPPFAPELDWEWMRCPMCGKRPFILEGRFLLYDQAGFLDIAEGLHRDPETGMLTGEIPGTALPPTADDASLAPPTGKIDGIVGVGVDHDKAADLQGSKSEAEPKPADPSTKPPTVLEEVYRLAYAGIKPGQISDELAKAGVTLHRLQIAKKLKERPS